MNVSTYLDHWRIRENPFLAEEARHDDVFRRIEKDFAHPDLSKILGDLRLPAPAVVFGRKGSGKTALRLQIEDAVSRYNTDHAGERILVIAYDDLNPVLDRFMAARRGKQTDAETLESLRLVDHVDGILGVAVPSLMDSALGEARPDSLAIGRGLGRRIRKFRKATARDTAVDWLTLQALYDRPERTIMRGAKLRRRLGFNRLRHFAWRNRMRIWAGRILLILTALLLIAAWLVYQEKVTVPKWPTDWLPLWAGYFAAVPPFVAGLALLTFARTRKLRASRLARRLTKEMPMGPRDHASLVQALEPMDRDDVVRADLPADDREDRRYGMLRRLRRAIQPAGYDKILILVDRLDEPTVVNGQPDRMWSVIRPMLVHKFLQQPGDEDGGDPKIAIKLLLPIEVRRELDRQPPSFIEEFRPDKANVVARLEWTGNTLFDLCSARLNACLVEGRDVLSLTDLFDDDVSREDLIHALGSMKQPRDAFKLMYQMIRRHCDGQPDGDETWRIPRHVLNHVVAEQHERMERMDRGWGAA